MRTRILLSVFLAVVLGLLVARLLRPVPQTAHENAPDSASAEARNPMPDFQIDTKGARTSASAQPQGQSAPDVAATSSSSPLPPGTNLQEQLQELARQRGVSLTVLTQQIAGELSNALFQSLSGPLDFYGKAVDETGAPLVGATVTFRCLVFPESQSTTNVPTDADGMFTLHGIRGRGISVTVTKPGYEELPGANERHFAYYGVVKGFQPDPSNPITFVLRKKAP